MVLIALCCHQISWGKRFQQRFPLGVFRPAPTALCQYDKHEPKNAMTKTPLPNANDFNAFSLVCLNSNGRFVRPGKDLDGFTDGEEIKPDQLPTFLKERIVLPEGVTDVFMWVHGWQNTHQEAIGSARRLFNGINLLAKRQPQRYPRLTPFVPAFLVVRWPSQSSFLPEGYKTIRDRATQLTEKGDAEFFLASLLGYLDQKNTRVGGQGSKTLAAAGGFYVHCLGHSFGGRFLTAAIKAAASPQPRTLSLMGSILSDDRLVLSVTSTNNFTFTVDSMLVFQMAAPSASFAPQLSTLIHDAPFRGPLVTTFSSSDKANCLWHKLIGDEQAIGCCGVRQPIQDVNTTPLLLADLSNNYAPKDFSTNIVNVDASAVFTDGNLMVGAHSDFFYEESIHLTLSLVNHVHQ
jgi:hypothetical protein